MHVQIRPAVRPCHHPSRRLRVLSAVLAAAMLTAPAVAAAERLRIAVPRTPVSLPLFVAAQRGYFRDEGLDVQIDDCIGGLRCLRRLLDGQAEFAATSEMPVVLHAFERGDVAILATIATSSDNLKLLARTASGVTRGEQLDGKNVGVIVNTAGQYMLETHLYNIGVDPRRVNMVPIQAEDMLAALRSGRVDAVCVWEPYAWQALQSAEPVALLLPFSGGYIETFNLVASRSRFGRDDALLEHLLRAIDRAESAIQADPAAAQATLARHLGVDQRFVDSVWHGLAFRLSLEQSLITTMESESRWAQREGHVAAGGSRPNVLTLIYPAPLKAIRPAAVGTGN